mgnify:CR=1 FL=1|jgi:hypothetical protein|tara:strand:+ start:26 stop:325 length:300 start_codon:yes stop_codon:yes gene_type:complete
MTDDNVKTMVDSLADGDNIAAQDAFKDALSDKIGSALDGKRMTVANDWLNAAHETEDLEQNAQYMKPSQEDSTEEEPVQEPVEIDNDEEPNEQPVVSEV